MAKRRTKRGNGDGSVFQMPDGSWRAVVSCGSIGGKRIRRTKKASTRDDAKAKLAELQEAIRGGKPAPAAMTVSQWLDEWLTLIDASEKAESTKYGYRLSVKNHIVPHLGAARLRDLTTAHVDTMIQRMKAGRRTKQLAFVVLQSALKRAVRKGLIPFNPCDSADKPTNKRKNILPFTVAEANAILEATKDHPYRAIYLLAMCLGVRQGEIFGLARTSIDFGTDIISIVRQLCEVKGHVFYRVPKTTSGTRSLTMTQTIREALLDAQAAILRSGYAGTDLAFVNEAGKEIRRSNFGKWHWRPLLKKLGIKHRGFHHCRHTAASLMLGAGIPIHVVSRILGHSKPSITLDLYSHLMVHQSAEATATIQKMLG